MVEEEQVEQPASQVETTKNKKPLIISGIIAFGVLFIATIIAVCIALAPRPTEQPDDDDTINYGYSVTNVDGTEFKPIYANGSNENLSLRFADLECDENCSNVSNLKIGDLTLNVGEDYEVKRGSVIIIIYKKILQAIQSGQYNITFDIKNGDETISVGVKITITNSSTPEDNTQEEQNEQNTSENQDDNNSSQPPVEPQPTADPEPEMTCSDLKNCDFNLNDQYVIETDTFNFYSLPDGVNLCDYKEPEVFYLDVTPIAETRTFYQIGNFTGSGGSNVPHAEPTRTLSTYAQADNYAAANGLISFHDGWGCGGMGDIIRDWTWQEMIDKGFALDEAKCATWGLSCGRW